MAARTPVLCPNQMDLPTSIGGVRWRTSKRKSGTLTSGSRTGAPSIQDDKEPSRAHTLNLAPFGGQAA
jgi:hypothetical protein